jgi:hypothetical protein
MIEGLVTLLFFLFDFTFTLAGVKIYTLLLVPPYLFVRHDSTVTVLFVGGIAVFMSELLHQHTLGSYMLGAGIALFIFDYFLAVINWHHLWPQAICLFLYFLILALTRLFLFRFVHGYWILPPIVPFLLTYLIGLGLIVYRFKFIGSGTPRSINDAF